VADLGVCASQNAALAYDFLVGKGLSAIQAAAVIGNLQFESGINPQLEAMDTDKLLHRGIAMWGPPRWQNLIAFGRDPWALDTQLDFLWLELQSYGLRQLRASTTVEDATTVFQNLFENPNKALAHTADRIKLARDALNCLSVRAPLVAPRGGVAFAAVGVLSLVAAVGYGIYKAFGTREPEPELPPSVFRPTYRPTWR
jgi:hypothetical protein